MSYTFGARLSFFDKNVSESYVRYGEVRLLAEKDETTPSREALQGVRLCWAARRSGA